MASIVKILNKLLPFATPGTPLLQDLLHLGVICAVLYFAPQIQERFRQQGQFNVQNEQEIRPLPEVVQVEEHHHHGQDGELNDQEPVAQDGAANDEPNFPPNEEPVAGPPNPARAPPQQRNVGAKKAKALARKDQRRAYNEFQRSQGEAQRARDAEGAAEREAAQAAERERRKAAVGQLEEKKAKEREKKRGMERKQREEEMGRREAAVEIVRRELEETRMSNVFDVARQIGGEADDVWLEKILNASGVLGQGKDGSFTMVTSLGWVVRVGMNDMARAYKRAAERGRKEGENITYEELGRCVESALRETQD